LILVHVNLVDIPDVVVVFHHRKLKHYAHTFQRMNS
jgi:hypothetical protein